MKKTHRRNVAGMQAAARCQALTKAGTPCQKPATRGTPLCQSHSYAPVGPVRRGEQIAYQRRAYVEQQQAIRAEARAIEKLVRRVKINSFPDWLIDELKLRVQSLFELGDRDAGRPRAETHNRSALMAAHSAQTHPPTSLAGSSTPLVTAIDRARDRALGAMLGLAVGEAVGVMMTGLDRSTREYSGMLGGGTLDVKRGEWTWDSAVAIALGDCLLRYPSFDERDYVERLLDHRDHGSYVPSGVAIGLGNMTALALSRYEQFGNPIAGDPDRNAPTNGFLARMAPVAVRFWNEPERLRDVAKRQARVTHVGDKLDELGSSFAEALGLAITGHSRSAVLSGRFVHPERAQTLTFGELTHVSQDSIISSSEADASYAAALWCVATGDGFEGAVHKALNLAGDSKSIGAMAGQLAGAIYGASRVPAHWLFQLAGRERIEQTALQLFDAGMAEAEGQQGQQGA